MTRADLSWAAVLSGGKSSRFGNNKALAEWNGEILIQRIVRQLRESFDNVMIISNDPEPYAFTGCPVFPDPLPGKGPLAGLCSALEHCGGDYLFLTACDMPYISEELIDEQRRRIWREEPDAAVIRNGAMIQPFRAFYRRSLLWRIDPASGRGLYSLIKEANASVIDGYEESFVNINRPKDLEDVRSSEL